ncbi:NfeD family protein [Cohnella terricola]|uniref:NfeD family protein n=1 Tax=Cohnella terricola TaxID=1289167 RepID=A0A559JEB6_9BACL|nr:NfeD family protein [Cohnella terricola]TVX98213.1 NfeD family protein [Cohnella terricola]
MDWWGIWLIVGGTLLIAELLTLTFYLLWLGVGAIVAAIVALIAPEAYLIQALAGGLAALVLTIYTKSLTRHFRKSKGYRDVYEDFVGKAGIVMEAISPESPGIVKIGSETWSAVSQEALPKDEHVRVIGRRTTVLEVQKWGGKTE